MSHVQNRHICLILKLTLYKYHIIIVDGFSFATKVI